MGTQKYGEPLKMRLFTIPTHHNGHLWPKRVSADEALDLRVGWSCLACLIAQESAVANLVRKVRCLGRKQGGSCPYLDYVTVRVRGEADATNGDHS